MKVDKFLETWINETIGKEEVAGEYERISLRAILYAAIANYRAPAWVQSPLRGL